MIWKTTLTFCFTLLIVCSSFAQLSADQPDLRNCQGWNCTSNNFTLTDVFLSLESVDGKPIDNTICEVGSDPVKVYVMLNYTSNASNTLNNARLFADLMIDEQPNYLDVFIGDVAGKGASGQKKIYEFMWTCGEELLLQDILVVWRTGGGSAELTTYDCGTFNKGQCEFPTEVIVAAPLAVQFDYSVCNLDDNATVYYESTTNGGIAPYTYQWDFQSDGTTDSTAENTIFKPTSSGFETTLKVVDSQGLTNTYSIPNIQIPSSLTAAAGDTAELTCSFTTLQLNGSGTGQGALTYSWTTTDGKIDSGAHTASPTVSLPGMYTLTVSDEVNDCIATDTVVITRDVSKPTAEAGDTAELTCSVTTLQLDGSASTGQETLSYAWTTADGTIDSGADTATPTISAPGTYTLTVTDADNGCVATDTVVITQDISKPTAGISNDNGLALSCSIPSTTLTATGGQSYSWTNAAGEDLGSSATLTVSTAGTFTVTVTGTNGCTNTASEIVNFIPDTEAPIVDVAPLPTINGQCSATVFNVPTATDNCKGTITGTTTDPLTYTEQGSYQVNWTFDDGNGNVTTAIQNVIVDDVTAPQAITLADATGECEVTVTAPTTSDNCEGTITGTTTDPLTYTEQGSYQVNWTFDDGNGNVTTAVQNVIVDDVTAPAAVTLADATGECEVTVTAPTTSDNCEGTITGTTNDPLTYTEQGSYQVNWTFDDGNGNVTTAVQNVIVDDVTAPAAITLADATGECEVTVTAPTTSDNCEGTITGTTNDPLTYTEQGSYEVNWTFDDGNGNVTTAIQNVIVDDVTAPAAITLADATGECEVTVTTPTTSDNCEGTITGTTNDPLTYTEQGSYEVNWIFDDGNGNVTTAIQNVIVNDVTAPEAVEIATITGNCEVTVTAPTTQDNCLGTITGTTNDALTYTELGEYEITWSFEDKNGNITTAKQQVVVQNTTAPVAPVLADVVAECETTVSVPTTTNACTGQVIEGTTNDPITYTSQGEYAITWTFDDGDGNSVTSTQKVIIDDTTAPAAVTLADATGECEVTVTAPTTEDNCEGTITGTTNDPLTYTEQGSYQVNWTFDDGNGNVTTAVQNVIVDDVTPPAAVTLADATGECEVTVTAPTTSDNCEGTITGTTNDPLTYTEQGSYEVNWTFDDGNGNVTTAIQNVIVDDVTAPAAIILADATGECEVTVTAPTTSDNCEGTITGTTTDPLTYTEQGSYEVNWIFDDGNGNVTTAIQNVIVNDVTAPEAVEIATITGNCEVTVTAPTTSDNCEGTITGTTTNPLTYSELGNYEITWTFDDNNGNITTATQQVVVQNTTAPVAPILADVVAQCETTVAVPTTTNSCTGQVIQGTTSDPLTYTSQGEYEITWTFDDGDGNSVTSTQKVIIDDITAPEAITLADATGECEVTVTAPTTSDNCEGTITGTTNDPLTYTEQGSYAINWSFDDGNGNVTTAVQNVIVDDITAPAAITLADATGECKVTVTAPTTSDNCEGTITGTTNDPLTYTEQGSYEVNWTFDDGNGNVTTAIQNVIVNDVTAPEAVEIATITGNCEVTVTAPTTQDNCSGTITGTTNDALTYTELGEYEITWTFEDKNGNITTAKQQVVVQNTTAPVAPILADVVAQCETTVAVPTTTNSCTGQVIQGTTNDPLTYTSQGEYEITWTFDDGDGNSATSTQKVIIDDTTAPEAITLPNATGECEVTVTAPTTSDNCKGTITGTTTDPLTYTEQGSYQVNWTFDDGNGNVTTAVQNVIVDDVTAPAAITIADATGECEVTVTAPTTSDNCEGTITGTTNDPLTYTEQGSYAITWTFDDGNGNVTTAVQNVIVDDVTAPVAVTPADATGECEVTVTAPTTSDNCEGTITGTTNDPLTYTEQGSYQVNWSFDDGNGNVTTAIQNVIVDDVTAPATVTLADATGECEVTVTAPVTSDNCEGTITGTTNDPLTYTEQGSYEVNWTFDDGNGNVTTAIQNIIVDDITAPVWTSELPVNATISCGELPAAQDLTAEDNCSVTVTYSEETTASDCASNYVVTRTWIATDASENTISHVQTITVEDTTAPTVAGSFEEVINITCEEIPIAPELTFEDNCSPEVNSEFKETMEDLEDGGLVITRTWTVNDCAGNEAVFVQTVNVDPTLPVIETTTADLCIDDEPKALSDLLLGEYNTSGTWEDTMKTGALENGVIDPSKMQVGNYTFDYVVTEGECSSRTTVQVSINDDCIVLACEIQDIRNSISKAVTPNGDQVNDSFEIKAGADCGFTYEVKIFNRWGNMVYESNDYLPGSNNSNWDGTSMTSVTGSQLPAGTYFYIVNIKQGGLEPIQGYIYLGTK